MDNFPFSSNQLNIMRFINIFTLSLITSNNKIIFSYLIINDSHYLINMNDGITLDIIKYYKRPMIKVEEDSRIEDIYYCLNPFCHKK